MKNLLILIRNVFIFCTRYGAMFFVSSYSLAFTTYFIDSGGNSSRIEESELCRTRSLEGLNNIRQLMGISDCAIAPEESVISQDIDVLILVDDHSGVEGSAAESIDSFPGRQLTCQSSSRRYVYPSYFVLRRADDQLKVLLVGEHLIQSYFSETDSTEPLAQYLQKIIRQNSSIPDSGITPSASSRSANNIPVGKGLFELQAMNQLVSDRFAPYKMDHMANNFHKNNLNWFAITSNIARMCEARLYTEFIRFDHLAFQFFVRNLNDPENPDAQVDEMIEAAKNINSNGIIIDIEGSFRRHNAEARNLYRIAREKVGDFNNRTGAGLSLGITVIGFNQISEYLTRSDLERADFLMPQIYNRGDNLSEDQLNQRIDFWLNEFSSEKVILLAGAHHCSLDSAALDQGCSSQRSKTAEEFLTSLAPFVSKARGAIGWWRYGNVEEGGHWERVRDFNLSNN